MSIINRAASAAAAPSDSEIISAIRGSPPVIAALADAATRRIAERQAAIDTLAEIDRVAARDFPKMLAASAAAVAVVKTAEAQLVDARRGVDRANADRLNRSITNSRTREQVEALLRSTAQNGAIDTFILTMRAEADAARKAFGFAHFEDRNPVTREKTSGTVSNKASVAARVAACSGAAVAAEALRFAADQSAVPLVLEALRAALPVVGGLELSRPDGAPSKVSGLVLMRGAPAAGTKANKESE